MSYAQCQDALPSQPYAGPGTLVEFWAVLETSNILLRFIASKKAADEQTPTQLSLRYPDSVKSDIRPLRLSVLSTPSVSSSKI
jgi:hypothetical protein